jgi:hypothetical protein
MTVRMNTQTSLIAPSYFQGIPDPGQAVAAFSKWVTVVIESGFRGFTDLFSRVHFFFHSYFYETINPNASLAQLQNTYFGLKTEKWKECIDGKYHHLGKDVFKYGLHKGVKEPEYVPSMEKAYQFVAKYLNKKVDADFYLQLHRITCGHFDGNPAVYLMGQEKVGVFRGSDDNVHWWPSGFYRIDPKAHLELLALDAEVKKTFGPSYGMGSIAVDPKWGCLKHCYHNMSRGQVAQVFNKFISDFYVEVEKAQTPDQRLIAIARLNKRLELLHPPKDGSGRTNTAFINKILTDYGFHPTILDQPFVSTTYPLNRWTEYLKEGLKKWEVERNGLSP